MYSDKIDPSGPGGQPKQQRAYSGYACDPGNNTYRDCHDKSSFFFLYSSVATV
jgi:hypothetical protein